MKTIEKGMLVEGRVVDNSQQGKYLSATGQVTAVFENTVIVATKEMGNVMIKKCDLLLLEK